MSLKDLLQKYDKEIFTDTIVEEMNVIVTKEVNSKVEDRMLAIQETNEAKYQELDEKITQIDEEYDKKEQAFQEAEITAVEKMLEEIKETLFESQEETMQNVALVKEGMMFHEMMEKIQKKYSIENLGEKVEKKEESVKMKDDYNKLYKMAESNFNRALKAETDLVLYTMAEDLETDTDKDKLLQISKTLNFKTVDEFKSALIESKKLLFDKESLNEDDKNTTKVNDEKKILDENTSTDDNEPKKNKYAWLNQ